MQISEFKSSSPQKPSYNNNDDDDDDKNIGTITYNYEFW